MGRLILVQQQGTTRISVFVSPVPLRAGPIDISVLLQNAETEQPIDSAEVHLRVGSNDASGPAIYAVATQAAATNKLLKAALFELPAPGAWDVEINYIANHDTADQVRCTLQAGPPLAKWFTVWPWFSWPAVVVLLYGLHRRLILRKPIRAAT
jgi:hypothetical protein